MGPDVDRRWQELAQTFSGLQSSLRLPSDGTLYDPRLSIVRQYLRQGDDRSARAYARSLTLDNHAAAYAALELLKECYIDWGKTDKAARVAIEAARQLREAEKQLAKRQKQRGW